MSQAVTAASSIPATSVLSSGPSASSGGAGTGGAGSGTTVLVPNPPPALSALGKGQVIRAVVGRPTADGQILLETRYGQIPVTLKDVPARGTILQFQVTQSGTPTELTLIDPGKSPGKVNPGGPANPQNIGAPRVGDTVTVRPVAADGAGRTPLAFQAQIVEAGGARSTLTSGAAGSGLLSGKVVSSPAGGPTILQTSTGQVALPSVGNLKAGAQLLLRPLAVSPQPVPGTPQTATQSLTALGTAWTALQDASNILGAADAGTAARILPTAIPATGPQLATGMAFFLNALFHGSMQEWLGRDAIRMLQDGDKSDLLKRLGDDFAQMSRLANEPANGDWRMVMLPLLDDRTLQQIRLYFREHGESEDAEDENTGTRFVIEASLSRLGAIQLDGFVRPARFDLMVRTHQELPEQMRVDIAGLFDAANREFSAQGQIDFQIQNPFGIQPETTDTAAGVYA